METGPKLGEILVQRRFISSLQLLEAVQEQIRLNRSTKRQFKLGEVLLLTKAITLPQLHEALLIQKNLH